MLSMKADKCYKARLYFHLLYCTMYILIAAALLAEFEECIYMKYCRKLLN